MVLPSYKEASNLITLLPLLNDTLKALPVSYEILVVDSESPLDNTPNVCREHKARHIPRRGGAMYGNAVRTGIEETQGDYVIFMDADGSHNPNFLRRLWQHRDNADMVIASRYVEGGRTENPAVLIFMSLMVNVVFRLVLGLKCLDVSNSFRLYNGPHLRALQLRCNNFDIVEEILVSLCSRHPQYRVKEVPFTFERRKAGKTKRRLVAFVFSYIVVLWRLYLAKRSAQKETL